MHTNIFLEIIFKNIRIVGGEGIIISCQIMQKATLYFPPT